MRLNGLCKVVYYNIQMGSLQSLDWNGGLEWWNGMLEWNGGMEWWNRNFSEKEIKRS